MFNVYPIQLNYNNSDPIIDIIIQTLNECGIYGEEVTIKLISVLKRIGRYDLLPSCLRDKNEINNG